MNSFSIGYSPVGPRSISPTGHQSQAIITKAGVLNKSMSFFVGDTNYYSLMVPEKITPLASRARQ